MTTACDLILLPGLAADARLLAPQKRAFPQLQTPAWIPPEKNETLPHYAARLAEGVRSARPLVLGGVSLGGMVAWEMASHLRPDAIVLVASCRTRAGIRPLLRALTPLARCLPAMVVACAKPVASRFCGCMSEAGAEQRSVLRDMFRDTDARFIHWACRAVLAWEPRVPDDVPVYHVHGATDRIIPANRVAADRVLPGGHLINLSHAEEVNRFLGEVIQDVSRAR